MICPKCEEGVLKEIIFKRNQKAFLCEYCGAVWMEGESISSKTGHTILALTKDGDLDYMFSDRDKDGGNKSVMYPKYK